MVFQIRKKFDNSKELDNCKRFQNSYSLMMLMIKDLSKMIIIVTIRMILTDDK